MIRPTAFAGIFYPADPAELRAAVHDHLARAAPPPLKGIPKALIVPHAGYLYSGPIAASAYACLAPTAGVIRRVILLGTAHSAVEGLAASGAEGFASPLGLVPLDGAALASLLGCPQVHVDDVAHGGDHALEVQLPFLQEVLDTFVMVPLLVGRTTQDHVAEVLEQLWDGEETLVIVSSDLSHYLDYEAARRVDQETARAIEGLRPGPIGPERACGHRAIGGLLHIARRHGLGAVTVDLRSSGDTAGPCHRVVGYGAFVLGPRSEIRAVGADHQAARGSEGDAEDR